MDKIKITFDARMSEHSGIGTYIKNMIREISKDSRVELTVICKSKNNIDLTRVSRVYCCETDIYTIKEQFDLIKFFPSDANAFFWSPHINIPLFYRGGRLIVTVHDLLFFEEKTFPQSLAKKLYRNLFFSRLTKKSKIIFTPSRFTKSELNKRYPHTAKKSFAIHLGVGEEWKKKIEVSRTKEILFVGNIKKNKNLSLLIKAFNIIKNKIPHKLVIIGASQNLRSKEDLNRFEIDPERVVIEGKLSDQDLCKRVAGAELVVCPSSYEGFGLVPLEAYSIGTKVLCSDIAVHLETMSSYASFFRSNDVQNCAEKILSALNNISTVDSAVVQNEYQWSKTANKSLELIKGAFVGNTK